MAERWDQETVHCTYQSKLPFFTMKDWNKILDNSFRLLHTKLAFWMFLSLFMKYLRILALQLFNDQWQLTLEVLSSILCQNKNRHRNLSFLQTLCCFRIDVHDQDALKVSHTNFIYSSPANETLKHCQLNSSWLTFASTSRAIVDEGVAGWASFGAS